MAEILIIYSTTDGQTKKICDRLEKVIEQQAHRVKVISIHEEANVDLAFFDKIIIGASIRYGKHNTRIVEFIEQNRILLENKANAFFSVNVVARKPEKSKPENNPYLQKFIKGISWKPRMLAVFAGKIDYPSYTFFDRLMIRLIMWMTKGPTDPKAIVEFTDWEQVDSFGRTFSEM